jgi:hypothetical protein
MVSVYDNIKLWHGYIDPNAAVFASYSTNTPNFFLNGVDAVTGAPPDAGAPVITNGLVNAGQSVTAGTSVSAGTTVTAGTSVSAGTTVTAGTFVYAGSGIGYQTGGSITQTGSNTNSVTLDKPTGRINMVQTNILSGAVVQFVLNNSFIGPNDMVVVSADKGGYAVNANVDQAGRCFIIVRNWTTGPLNESLRIQFAVIKGALA